MRTNEQSVAKIVALLNEFTDLKKGHAETGDADIEGVAIAIAEETGLIPEASVDAREVSFLYYNYTTGLFEDRRHSVVK